MVSTIFLGRNTTTGSNNTDPRNNTMKTELMYILNTGMWYFPIDNLFSNNKWDFFSKLVSFSPFSQLILLLRNFFTNIVRSLPHLIDMCTVVQKLFFQVLWSIGQTPFFTNLWIFQVGNFFISQTKAPSPIYTAYTYDKHVLQVTSLKEK